MHLKHWTCLGAVALLLSMVACSDKKDTPYVSTDPMATNAPIETFLQEGSTQYPTESLSPTEILTDSMGSTLSPTQETEPYFPSTSTSSESMDPTESHPATTPSEPKDPISTVKPTESTAPTTPVAPSTTATPSEVTQATTAPTSSEATQPTTAPPTDTSPTEPPTTQKPTETPTAPNPTESTNPTSPPDPTETTTPTSSEETPTYRVDFLDYNGTLLHSQEVLAGEDAVLPSDPYRPSYIFAQWSGNYQNIQGPCTLTASYVREDAPNLFLIENTVIGNQVSVKLFLSGSICTSGFQCFLDYDESVLQFQSLKKYNSVEANHVRIQNNARIALAWSNSVNMTNSTIRNQGLLLELNFTVIDSKARNSILYFLQDGFLVDSVDDNGQYASEPYTLTRSVIHIS